MAWGALGGFFLGGLAVATGLVGLSFSVLGAVVVAVSVLLGAGSAGGTLAVARAADTRVLLEGADEVEDVGLTSAEVRQLLGTTQ